MRQAEIERLRAVVAEGDKLERRLGTPRVSPQLMGWFTDASMVVDEIVPKFAEPFAIGSGMRMPAPDQLTVDHPHRVEVLKVALRWAEERFTRGPPSLDSIELAQHLASEIPLKHVGRYLDEAREALDRSQWEDAAQKAAHGLERALFELVDLVTANKAPREFKNGVQTLVDNGVIPDETARALSVRDVGVWGWLCIKGRHAEGAAAGKPAETPAEGTYALHSASAAITLLGTAYLDWRAGVSNGISGR